MTTHYAGIGSRQAPKSVLSAMYGIAHLFATRGYVLRSGGAEGSDTAFEQGCDAANGEKEIYLPWNGFNNRNARTEVGVLAGVTPAALGLASRIHPNWPACSQGARQLHARNCYQILGKDLQLQDASKFVVCWTPNGSGSGGTGQAIRLAKKLGVPVYDIGSSDGILRLKEDWDVS